MKHTSFEKAPKHTNQSAVISEYGGNGRIDMAHAKINGIYPPEVGGWAVNDQCDVSFFVYAGEGKFEGRYEDDSGQTRELKVALGEKAVVQVFAGERYRFDGHDLELVISSAPQWSPEQARIVYE